jgi:hypothetical protein
MNTKKLIEQLRKTASTLAPLTNIKPPITGDLAQGNWKQPEPYAFAWRSKLDTIANMIEYQLCALSPNKIVYIRGTLFQGMGSLRDLIFDPTVLGPEAEAVNENPSKEMGLLAACFDE